MDGAESVHSESNPGTPLPIDVDDNGSVCVLCQKTLSRDEEALCVCGDCKFLLLEDFSSPTRHASGGGRRRRRRRRRVSTVASSGIASEPSVFGGQFIASTATTTLSDDDRPTRRWRVMLSDSENSDSSVSIYVGSESTNASFRLFHGESSSDANSVGGGESEDDHSFLETGMLFLPSLAISDLDSDLDDIDPMHAGPVNWDWEEDEEEEPEAWIRVHSRRRRRGGFEEFLVQQESDPWGTPTPAAKSFVNSLPRIVITKDELDNSSSSSKKENESSDLKESSSSSMCAICKDLFMVGSEAVQLPCVHLYHPSCILPWLRTRNSCPLCRYGLPTNDSEYEESRNRRRYGITANSGVLQNEGWDSSGGVVEAEEELEIIEQVVIVRDDGNSSDDDDGSAGENTDRNGWFSRLKAAAPIVGLVGVVFVVLMGKPATGTSMGLNLRNQQGRGGSRWRWQWPWV